MSMQTIYTRLVQSGMSPVGACAMMGNMQAESGLKANIVEKRCSISDEDYTAKVDAGAYADFATDNGKHYGYGLCQWTYPQRKINLLNFARQRGVSVGDEAMQVDFCVHELRSDYPALWAYLCTCTGVSNAAARICKEYERPAELTENIKRRSEYANNFYMTLRDTDVNTPTGEPEDAIFHTPAGAAGGETMCNVSLPVLRKGNKSGYVAAAQTLLEMRGVNCGSIDGDFGKRTLAAVEKYQKKKGLTVDGLVGKNTWAALLEGR